MVVSHRASHHSDGIITEQSISDSSLPQVLAPELTDLGPELNEHAPLLPKSPAAKNFTPEIPLRAYNYLQFPNKIVKLIPFLCALLVFVLDFSEYLRIASKTRLYELGACRDYYLLHDPGKVDARTGFVEERCCKVEEVQGRLAMLKGWAMFFDGVPALLVAVPYGILADRKGRRLVMFLTLTGQILAEVWILIVCNFYKIFSLNLVWATSLFQLIGGGPSVIVALLLSIVADVAPENRRATMFFYLSATMLTTEMIAPPLGSYLMQPNSDSTVDNIKSLWRPLLIALPIQSLGFLVISFLPETLKAPSMADDSATDYETSEIRDKCIPHKLLSQSLALLRKSKALRTVLSPRILLCLMGCLVTRLGRQSLDILLQFVSKRFGWTLAQAGYLISLRAGVNVILFVIVLPLLASKMSDLWIARWSVFLLSIGSVGIGVSWGGIPGMVFSLVVFTLGFGFRPALQSVVTGMVRKDHVASLYTGISAMDALGGLFAGPALAATFDWGLKKGSGWLGLPFLVSGGLFAVAGTGIWVLRENSMVPERGDDGDGDIERA
ncbi:hypothetical protein RUND412_001879 [Rhizina undulata]